MHSEVLRMFFILRGCQLLRALEKGETVKQWDFASAMVFSQFNEIFEMLLHIWVV